MQISEGLVVTIEYTLRDGAGVVLESTKDRGAVTFKMGSVRMLPGLEKAIEGMEVGESRTGRIPPGELVPKGFTATREVPRAEFPQGVAPDVGMRFQAKDADGKALHFEVIEATDEVVQVQLLHPLHDTEVHYEVSVIAARRSNLPPPPPVDVPDLTDDLLED